MRQEKNNKDFFYLLHTHYALVRSICISGRHFTGRDEAIQFIADFYGEQNQGVQAMSLFERMRDCGMLIKNHALWGIPSYITLFVRKREGRSSYTSQHLVRACLQDIRTHIYSLNSMLNASGMITVDEFIEEIFAIEDVYQQLAGASQNNCHKISVDVASFQLDGALEVSSSKIQRFHHLYDSYIMPMLAIVVDPDNELEDISRELIQVCDRILRDYPNLENLTYHLQGLKQSVKVIQERIAGKILQAKNELDALFEVYREHRRIIRGINQFWEMKLDERVDELEQVYDRHFATSSRLRYQNSSDRAFEKHIHQHIYAEQVKKRAPQLHSLTAEAAENGAQPSFLISFVEIRDQLLKQNHIDCLLDWLYERYPNENATFFIEKLFELEKRYPDKIRTTDQLKQYQLGTIKMELKIREWHHG